MKSLCIITAAVFSGLVLHSSTHAGLVTLLAGESYQLSSNDVAEVLSVLPGNPISATNGFTVTPNAILLVDGKVVATTGNSGNAHAPFAAQQLGVIAGPRTISSISSPGGSIGAATYSPFWSMVTLRITDKVTFEQSRSGSTPALTAVIPNDPGNFNVVLETSSDLVTWHAALPGSYGGGSTNRFFRVRVERAP